MTRAEQHATGDSIVQELNGRKPGDSLADVAKDLTDAHAHRPGLFNQDLTEVSQKLHEQGILPGFDLVGVQGQDLIAKDSTGKLTVFDATNLDRSHALDKPASTTPLNGRDATTNADGSGQVTVNKGDTAWSISKDVLKSQGIDSPTDNQVANYIKELELANGKPALRHLHPGDTLKLPASTVGGNQTDFQSERAVDNLTLNDAAIDKQVADAKQVIRDLGFDGWGDFSNIKKEEIGKALDTMALTDQQRQSLNFLHDNFDAMKGIGAFGGQDFMTLMQRGDTVWMGGLDDYAKNAKNDAALAALHQGM